MDAARPRRALVTVAAGVVVPLAGRLGGPTFSPSSRVTDRDAEIAMLTF